MNPRKHRPILGSRLPLRALIFTALLIPAGCEKGNTPREARAGTLAPTVAVPGIAVDVDWLARHRSAEGLVIVDARQPDAYAAGHIAGAVNIPTKALLDPDPANSRNMAPITLIQSVLSRAGIDMSQVIVIYDDADYREAARVFWVMEVHGLPSVCVLDGGLAAWQERGLPLTATATRVKPRRFIANMQPQRLATKLTVARAMSEPGTVILDSRSADEYRGLVSKANRAGHIKSAVNVDFERNLVFNKTGACTLRFSDELVDLYRNELATSKKVISYCNSGNRASVSYLALRIIGYDAAVYDGSWLEWGNDPDLPIE